MRTKLIQTEYAEALGFATDAISQVCDFLSEHSHAPVQKFNEQIELVRQHHPHDMPGLDQLPKSTLKQIGIMANFFGHYQTQVKLQSKTPLIDAIAPTVADQLSNVGIDAIISKMKYGAKGVSNALFISGLAKALDDYDPFHQAVARLAKQQDTKIQQHLDKLDENYGNVINAAMHVGAKNHVLDAEFNVHMQSMFARAIDGILDPIKDAVVDGVNKVKDFLFSEETDFKMKRTNYEGGLMQASSLMDPSLNLQDMMDEVVKKNFNILIARCGNNRQKIEELNTTFSKYAQEHRQMLANINDTVEDNNQKIVKTLNYVVTINKKLTRMEQKANTAKQQAQVLANFQGVTDAFNLISNIGQVSNNKGIQIFGAVGMSLTQGILGVAKLTGTMGVSRVIGAAMLTPATAIIGAALTIGSLFLNKNQGKKQAKAMQQLFEAISKQIVNLHQDMHRGFKLVYNNQEKMWNMLVDNFCCVYNNFYSLFIQTNRIETKIDAMAISVEEIKQTLQQHALAQKCDEVQKVQNNSLRALFAYIENKEERYDERIRKTLQLIEEQLHFSLSDNCRNLSDQNNHLSGWFYVLHFEALLSQKDFSEFTVELTNVVNFTWWRNIVGCYLQVAFCVTMDSPVVTGQKQQVGELIKKTAGATSQFIEQIMDERFIKAFLNCYQNKLEKIHQSAKTILDEMNRKYSKAGMTEYAKNVIANQQPVIHWGPILKAIKKESKYQSNHYKEYEKLIAYAKEYNKCLEGFRFDFENLFMNAGVDFSHIYPHLQPIDEASYQGYKPKSETVDVGGRNVELHYIDGELKNPFKGYVATKNAIDRFTLKVRNHLRVQKEYLDSVQHFVELSELLLNNDISVDTSTAHVENQHENLTNFTFKAKEENETMYMPGKKQPNKSASIVRHWSEGQEIDVFESAEYNENFFRPEVDSFFDFSADLKKRKAKYASQQRQFSAENINDILQEIQPAFEAIKAINGYDAVYVLGDSGVGKSTLLNTLFGCEYQVKGYGIRANVERTNKVDELFIRGDGADSQTLFPKVVSAPGKDFALCDMPGMYENRGENKRICAATVAHLLNLTLQENKKMVRGIVFVIDSNDLVAKGKSFRQNMLALGKMLKCHYQFISESVSFVITKDKELTFDEIEKYIKKQHTSLSNINNQNRTEDENIIFGVLTQMKLMTENTTLRKRFHITGKVLGDTLRKELIESVSACIRQSSASVDFFEHNKSQEKFIEHIQEAAKRYLAYKQQSQNFNKIMSDVRKASHVREDAVKDLSTRICALKRKHASKKDDSVRLKNEKETLKAEIKVLEATVKEHDDNIKAIKNKTDLRNIGKPITFTHKAEMVPETKGKWKEVDVNKKRPFETINFAYNTHKAKGWTVHPDTLRTQKVLKNSKYKKRHHWDEVWCTKVVSVPSQAQCDVERSTDEYPHPISVITDSTPGVTVNLIEDAGNRNHNKWKITYCLGQDCDFKATVQAQERYLDDNPKALRNYEEAKKKAEADIIKYKGRLSKLEEEIKVNNDYFKQGKTVELTTKYEGLLKQYEKEIANLKVQKVQCASEIAAVNGYLVEHQASFQSIYDILKILKFTDEEGIVQRFMQTFSSHGPEQKPTENNTTTINDTESNMGADNPARNHSTVYGGHGKTQTKTNAKLQENTAANANRHVKSLVNVK